MLSDHFLTTATDADRDAYKKWTDAIAAAVDARALDRGAWTLADRAAQNILFIRHLLRQVGAHSRSATIDEAVRTALLTLDDVCSDLFGAMDVAAENERDAA